MGEAGSWEGEAWACLRDALGDEPSASLHASWQSHANKDRPVVCVFGPYDSGKTSLVKRLLLEEGRQVPEWLTVSARRETYDVNEARLGSFILRDTPGVAGGKPEHEAAAREALLLADAYLVVLLPQRLDDDRDSVLDLLSGYYFDATGAPFAAEARLVAVSRMDEAGVNPDDDLDGFNDLRSRKLEELRAMLRTRKELANADIQLLAVAPDPFQMVGSSTDVDPSLYADSSAWDGFGTLRDALESLRNRLPALRRGALHRYLLGLLKQMRDAQLEHVDVEKAASERATQEVERYRLQLKRLETLLSQQRAQLNAKVEEVLLEAGRRSSDNADGVLALVNTRLKAALDGWRSAADAGLDKQVTEAETELASAKGKPVRRIATSDVGLSTATDPFQFGKFTKKLGSLGAGIRKAVGIYQKNELGMTVDAARKELQKLNAASSLDAYRKTGRAVAFASKEGAEKAARHVKWATVIDAAGPILEAGLPLVTEIVDGVRSGQQAKERAKQREDFRKELRKVVKQVSESVWTEWSPRPAELKKWLVQLRDAAEKTSKAQDAAVARLEGLVDRGSELAKRCPR